MNRTAKNLIKQAAAEGVLLINIPPAIQHIERCSDLGPLQAAKSLINYLVPIVGYFNRLPVEGVNITCSDSFAVDRRTPSFKDNKQKYLDDFSVGLTKERFEEILDKTFFDTEAFTVGCIRTALNQISDAITNSEEIKAERIAIAEQVRLEEQKQYEEQRKLAIDTFHGRIKRAFDEALAGEKLKEYEHYLIYIESAELRWHMKRKELNEDVASHLLSSLVNGFSMTNKHINSSNVRVSIADDECYLPTVIGSTVYAHR